MKRIRGFSIRFQLAVCFGLLFFISISSISAVLVHELHKNLHERADRNMKTIAESQALLFEERFIKQQRQYAEAISRRSIVSDPNTSVWEKVQDVQKELSLNTGKGWNRLAIADINGEGFRTDGTVMHAKDYDWFVASIKGNFHFMAPYLSYKNKNRCQYNQYHQNINRDNCPHKSVNRTENFIVVNHCDHCPTH